MSMYNHCKEKDCKNYDESFERYCAAPETYVSSYAVVDGEGLSKPFKACSDDDLWCYTKKEALNEN